MEKQVVALDEELTSLKLTVAELEKERWEIKGRVYNDFIISDFFSISFGKNIPPVGFSPVLSCMHDVAYMYLIHIYVIYI